MTDRIIAADVRRAWSQHMDALRDIGIDAPRADLVVQHPGSGEPVRYEVINTPTMSTATMIGARAAYEHITAATFTARAVAREVKS